MLRLPDIRSIAAIQLVTRASALGLSGVLLQAHDLTDGLRRCLTRTWDLARKWVRWIRVHHGLDARDAILLRDIIRIAPIALDLTDLCSRIHVPARTVTYHLKQAGLPKLERWYGGARLLRADLALQRDPDLDPFVVALRLGYADEMGFSNRYYQHFGLTPTRARRLLGLEWRLESWWARSSHGDGNKLPSPILIALDLP
ncbi:MAG TPA: helix-turn-helix domain-containing protein [Longimicrobiaceae bacterium]|nr:helix-turn-helix domain-containing protein [Longimicrobiaceae bacterium]